MNVSKAKVAIWPCYANCPVKVLPLWKGVYSCTDGLIIERAFPVGTAKNWRDGWVGVFLLELGLWWDISSLSQSGGKGSFVLGNEWNQKPGMSVLGYTTHSVLALKWAQDLFKGYHSFKKMFWDLVIHSSWLYTSADFAVLLGNGSCCARYVFTVLLENQNLYIVLRRRPDKPSARVYKGCIRSTR